MSIEHKRESAVQHFSPNTMIPLKSEETLVHIASFAARVTSHELSAFQDLIQSIEGCELAHIDEHGHAILLVEAEDSHEITELHKRLSVQPGVMNINLVYHHVEELDELDSLVTVQGEG